MHIIRNEFQCGHLVCFPHVVGKFVPRSVCYWDTPESLSSSVRRCPLRGPA